MKRKILITGALGFIGQYLIKNCFKNYEILGVDNKKPEKDLNNDSSFFKLYNVDLRDSQSIQQFWKEIEPFHKEIEAIIHLAAYYDFSNKPHPNYVKLQIGLKSLLDLMEKDLPKSCCFISAASMASFRSTVPGIPLTEKSLRSIAWEYPKSKVFNEAIIDNFKTKKVKVHLILAAVYSDFCELVPLYQSIELLRSKSLQSYFYPGPLKRGLTYLHLTDAGKAFEEALSFSKKKNIRTLADQNERNNYRFLIGEERAFTYEDIHRKVTLYFNKKFKYLLRVPKFLASIGYLLLWPFNFFQKRSSFIKLWMIPFSGEHFEFDLKVSKKELNWRPQKLIHEEFPSILEKAKKHKDKWHELNQKRPWKRASLKS